MFFFHLKNKQIRGFDILSQWVLSQLTKNVNYSVWGKAEKLIIIIKIEGFPIFNEKSELFVMSFSGKIKFIYVYWLQSVSVPHHNLKCKVQNSANKKKVLTRSSDQISTCHNLISFSIENRFMIAIPYNVNRG